MWWDDLHDWSTAMDGYDLIRTDRTNKASILVGVCYRPPSQDEEVDELFYKKLEDVSRSPTLGLVGDFNLPDICWELSTVEKRQSKSVWSTASCHSCLGHSLGFSLLAPVPQPRPGTAPGPLTKPPRKQTTRSLSLPPRAVGQDVNNAILPPSWETLLYLLHHRCVVTLLEPDRGAVRNGLRDVTGRMALVIACCSSGKMVFVEGRRGFRRFSSRPSFCIRRTSQGRLPESTGKPRIGHPEDFSRMKNPDSLGFSSQKMYSIPLIGFWWPYSGFGPTSQCTFCAGDPTAGCSTYDPSKYNKFP
ncbi:uncharacterized protein LOC120410360 [Corvus cornix cornix]|uniref:uncharacterized protein LOC120410360 n=1 Tax=Corvus cornix cornix TaxID=932674 RepID=UPI0019519272|nr:uncharacterized protein LOC120410360 [Corvus cornix cornix]